MLKVAVVDHHLNNFHADKFLSLLRGPLAGEGVEIVSAWESNPIGDDWCVKNSVRRYSSPEDAIRDADAVMLLAPDNVDVHLEVAKSVLPSGKPTFIDKFLAPNSREADAILELAEHCGTPIFSSSALRCAVEIENLQDELSEAPITEMFARGMGDWNGYGVHTLAMAFRVMGCGVKRVIDTGTETARTVTLDYGGLRRAVLDVRTASNEWDVFGWSFGARIGTRYVTASVKDYDGFYSNLMRRVAEFFRSGKSDVTPSEMLASVAVLNAANRSLSAGGEWIDIGEVA